MEILELKCLITKIKTLWISSAEEQRRQKKGTSDLGDRTIQITRFQQQRKNFCFEKTK